MDFIDSKGSLELTDGAIAHIASLRKWTKFLSIVGFVFLGLMIVLVPIMLIGSSALGASPFGAIAILPMFLIIALYIYPIYTLFMFSKHSKVAIEGRDASQFEVAFKHLKGHYQYMGILTIIVLGIYAMAFLFGSMAAMFI